MSKKNEEPLVSIDEDSKENRYEELPLRMKAKIPATETAIDGDLIPEEEEDTIGEEQTWDSIKVQEALHRYAKKVAFKKKTKAAKKVRIQKIEPTCIYLARIETLYETRTLNEKAKKAFNPDKDKLDDSTKGTPQNKWDVEIKPKLENSREKQKKEIPHTQKMVKCEKCAGFKNLFNSGTIPCEEKTCKGKPKADRKCGKCYGTGKIDCKDCKGSGKQATYSEITAIWNLESDEIILNKDTSIPIKKIRKVIRRDPIVLEENVENVRELVTNRTHENALGEICDKKWQERDVPENDKDKIHILKRQIKVWRIPTAIVHYEDKKRAGQFYVFGSEMRIYFPELAANYSPVK